MTLRCLLIDDSDEFLASATRLLEAQGAEVVGSATSYQEALQLAETVTPSVALVDVELGDEDGVALARELEARLPSTRVILISAHDPRDLDLVSVSPDADFISKEALGVDAIKTLLR